MDMMDASIKTVETESSMPVVESFLIGLSPVVIETKLESKMRRLLNKYRDRKSQELARKREWMVVNAERPDPEHDHPVDKKLIEEAQQTIGNYKLKTDPNFEAEEEERETVAKKLEELIRTREDVYNIRNEYNQKVFGLRDKKKDLTAYIQRKLEKLDEIHLEIPEGQRRKPQIVVTFEFDREFPEKNLDLKRYLMPENYEKDLISSGNETAPKSSREIVEKNLANVQRKVLYENGTMLVDVNRSPNLNRKVYERVLTANRNYSDWEIEMKQLRTRRRLFEQDKIINKINARIADFDEEIEKLSDDRYEVEVKAKFKELYLLTLNHELMILKDFETVEENLADVVDNKDSERKHLLNRIGQTKHEIEALQKTIAELYDAKSEVEQRFKSNCMDSKFVPFLKKIFKKKLQSEEDDIDKKEEYESIASSDSGSMEEGSSEMKSLDEKECPKGCDRNLYILTFELRHERHEIEQSIRMKKNDIDSYQNDVETMTQRQEKASKDFAIQKTKLTEMRQRKQNMLNEVNTVVCLKMDQMQYFKNQPEFENIGSTLLFNNHNVIKLYSRVGKLALETIEAKRKHRINVIHLAKMKTDIKFMEKQITDLKDETSQAMLKKFGRVIDLNEVEETILRRFAFEMQVEMRANAEDIKRQYFNKINDLKKTKIAKEEMLNRVIQEATEKLNILTVLEEEKNFLHKIISMQGRRKEMRAAGIPYREIDNDLSKLKEISDHQKEQIEMLQREIRALSLKSKSFVDARQEFESINYSIMQLRGECRFEDSICSNPDESMLSSTRATTPDNEIFNEISKMVKKFIEDSFCEQLEDVEIENISLNFAKYLTNISVNFSNLEADEILKDVINNFDNFLPKHVRVTPESIAELVAQVIGNFDNTNDVNRLEVLKEIVNNTIESANQTAITSNSYLQHILTEIFKQMVITMRFNEITSSDCSSTIIERLSKLNSLQTSNVNVDVLVKEILEYANDNMEDGVDGQALKKIISNIITKLTE